MDESSRRTSGSNNAPRAGMTENFQRELAQHVKSGAVSKDLAESLRRELDDKARAADDNETPKVARGFNDVMLALGTGIIVVALMSQWVTFGSTVSPFVYATFPVLWLISEILDVRRKAILPGIVAVIGMTIAAVYLGARYGYSFTSERFLSRSFSELMQYPAQVLLFAALAAALVNALYYARFRLPFALLPLALGVGIAATNALVLALGWEKATSIPHLLGLGFGLLLFAVAMWYDTSDPLRRTRNADCGFWLHLAAAPLIVHSLLSIFGGTAMARSGGGSGFTMVLVTALTLVALAIDRRALIVASLSYLLAAVGYVVSTASQVLGGSTFATLVVLGVIVLIVGMGWHPARRILLAPFAGQKWLEKLPPVQT